MRWLTRVKSSYTIVAANSLAAAAILGVPVQALVLDTQAIKPVFFESKLKSLLSIFTLFPKGSKEYGEAYVRFLTNGGQEPAAPTNLSDDAELIQEQAKEIAERLRDYSQKKTVRAVAVPTRELLRLGNVTYSRAIYRE